MGGGKAGGGREGGGVLGCGSSGGGGTLGGARRHQHVWLDPSQRFETSWWLLHTTLPCIASTGSSGLDAFSPTCTHTPCNEAICGSYTGKKSVSVGAAPMNVS